MSRTALVSLAVIAAELVYGLLAVSGEALLLQYGHPFQMAVFGVLLAVPPPSLLWFDRPAKPRQTYPQTLRFIPLKSPVGGRPLGPFSGRPRVFFRS